MALSQRLLGVIERIAGSLSPLVALRDGFLVVGAGCYLLGYAVWSFYAWIYHLGLLPLLSAQYIVAGATIGVFLLFALSVSRGLWLLRARLPSWLDPTVQSTLTIRWAISAVSSLALLIAITSSVVAGDSIVAPVCMFIFALTVFFTVKVPQLPTWLARSYERVARLPGFKLYGFLIDSVVNPGSLEWLGWFYGMVLTALIPFLLLAVAFATFALLPQEFGGARPVCAYMDVDWSMISTETRAALLAEPSNPAARVARSVRVDVLFSGSESVFVRPDATQEGKPRRVYELSSKLITSKVDCD